MTVPTRRFAGRKVLGSAAVLGAAAAVAGLGAFGTFTGSTTPATTAVSDGTVAISLSQQGGGTLPLAMQGLLPGDSLIRAVDLSNTGNTALSTLHLTSAATTSNALSTDTTNGLQLALAKCSVAWTQTGTTTPTYSCGGTTSSLYNGPAVTESDLVGLNTPTVGGVDYLLLTIWLPSTAGDRLEDLTNTLNVTFTGVQRTGRAR